MTDKLLEKKKKEFKKEFPNLMMWVRESEKVSSEYNIQEVVWDFIEKLVEEVERDALEGIVGLSIEMEGSFNNAMFNSGFGTALYEIYYRLSDGKFLDEVLEEKSKKTTNLLINVCDEKGKTSNNDRRYVSSDKTQRHRKLFRIEEEAKT